MSHRITNIIRAERTHFHGHKSANSWVFVADVGHVVPTLGYGGTGITLASVRLPLYPLDRGQPGQGVAGKLGIGQVNKILIQMLDKN